MYGELVMDAVPEKVHFFNSFFHRQLVTKGYNGVKRWTKKVPLACCHQCWGSAGLGSVTNLELGYSVLFAKDGLAEELYKMGRA